MANSQIIHVNDNNFQIEVLSFSQNTPVVVEFWASWCRDCRTFYPELESIILDAYPHIRLAKINVDENPNTTLRYSVRSLPNIKAFSYARIVDQVTGIVPGKRLEEMLSKVNTLGQNTLTFEKAINLYEDQNYAAAEMEFKQYIDQNPDSPDALLAMAKTLLAQQKYRDALLILNHFPPSRQSDIAGQLHYFSKIMQQFQSNELPNRSPLEATFITTLRLIQMKNYEAALDGLLDILKQDKGFRSGAAKAVFLAILEMLPDSRINSRKYRMELSSILF